MKCSCCLFERHGYMCSCIACVIYSLPDYPGPTHHDFSVCHWKAYMHYGMLSVKTDDKKLTSMGQAIEAAMHNDVKGPSVPSECVTRTPRPFPVPKRFNTKITKVEAYNYTVVESDFLEFTPFDKTTFIFNGTKQNFEKELQSFTSECELRRRVDSTSSNAYSYLVQPFKEMAAALDDQSNGSHLLEAKTMMQDFTQKSIARAANLYNKNAPPQGKVQPYCVPKDKKRKVNHSSR